MGVHVESLLWTGEKVMAWLKEEFPQAFLGGRGYKILDLKPGFASVQVTFSEDNLRPGGTVSGPAMMELVDFSAYALLIAHYGSDAELSVTTNLNMSFLRKPKPGPVICDIEIIKHGRTLIVTAAKVSSAADEWLVAHAELTYFNAAG